MIKDNISVTTIVVTWNNEKTIEACLDSVSESTGMINQQIIIVDNASSDQTVALIKQQNKLIQVISNKQNLGFAAAINQGLEQAVGELILILNPDAKLAKDCLALLIERLVSDEQVMVIGPQLLNSDNSIQLSGRKLPNLRSLWLSMFIPTSWKQSAWYKRTLFNRANFDHEAQVQEVSGACFLAKQQAFSLIGQFDEDYFLYYEETDWFKRLTKTPGQVIYYPAAKVIHHWGHSMVQDQINTDLTFYQSQLLYSRRHFLWWQQWLLLSFMLVQAVLGSLKSMIMFKFKRYSDFYFKLIRIIIINGIMGKTNDRT